LLDVKAGTCKLTGLADRAEWLVARLNWQVIQMFGPVSRNWQKGWAVTKDLD